MIKLSTGTELTIEEVKEVIENFKDLSKPKANEYADLLKFKKNECTPCPIYVYPTYPVPTNPYYGGIQPYCQTQGSAGK